MGVIEVLEGQHKGSVHVSAKGAADVPATSAEREAAFHRLVDRQLDRCYRLAAVVLGDQADAQDAVHDAFVTAWRRYETLRDPARFEAWFDRIVVNACRDRMRRARRHRTEDLSARIDIAGPDSTNPIADEIVVRRALDRMKPDDRIVLALRFYRDMRVDDIAEAMDINPGAASSRLYRAVERLRSILDDDEQQALR
jgi:RNA polymerase sigma-70 factor (ECF subfamily)